MKVAVKIMPRAEVLDLQGRAVGKTLEQMGHQVQACHVGKYIVLEFAGSNEKQALEKASEIAEKLLANSLIERFEVEALH